MFHMKQHKAPRAAVTALALSVLLGGCVSFGAKPPEQLLSLSPAQRVTAGVATNVAQAPSLVVADPEAPRILDTVRVPVRVSPTSVAYVTKVQWSDTPRHLFQGLLAETIAASGSRIVLDPGQYSGVPGQRLMGALVDFGIDEQSRSAIVTYDAILANPGGAILARQRFTAQEPVSGKIGPGTVGAPLNAAANKVAADVAAWLSTVTQP
ncbi:cholesterol transport system auxiliary component [Sphingobium faniae]|nr:cholesterol transport system auxiliary component [Sphingobium faniae]